MHLMSTARSAALIALAVAGVLGIANAYGATARAARVISATDTAHLHEVKSPGSRILEVGRATGTLPGTVKASISVGATVNATFTIYPQGGGSITGRGSGELKGRPAEPSFGGKYVVTAGTGRYSHAHGTGGLYGTLNRQTLALTVSTTGKFSY
jgi:hypothetical protein